MKKKFVTYTLTLCVLLLVAMPAQVFAATGCAETNNGQGNVNYYTQSKQNCNYDYNYDCNYNYNNYNNINYSKNCNIKYVNAQDCNSKSRNFSSYDCLTKACKTNDCKTNDCKTSNCLTQDCESRDYTTSYCAPGKANTPSVPGKPETSNAPGKQEAPSKQDIPSGNLSGYAQQVVDLVNKERAAAGLPALKVNTKLAGVAVKKAEAMRDKNYFSHTSPTYGSPFDMMSQFGIKYTAAGENIAKGQKSPASVMSGWMNSSGHRANIMSTKYDQIGVGYVTDSKGNTYWVQMFIK